MLLGWRKNICQNFICFDIWSGLNIVLKFTDDVAESAKLPGFMPFFKFSLYVYIIDFIIYWANVAAFVCQTVKGSTVLFTALLKKCIEKGVVAICRYTARNNTPPRFVALFPQVWMIISLFACFDLCHPLTKHFWLRFVLSWHWFSYRKLC